MAQCDTCGNEYEKSFEVRLGGRTYTFDCFECAEFMLAPTCENCDCRIIGHGVQADDQMFCCAHCARMKGIHGLETHLGDHSHQVAK